MIIILGIIMIASLMAVVIIHYWWKKTIKQGVVNAGTMNQRKRMRNIQIFLTILFMSLLVYVFEIIIGEEISGFQTMIMFGVLFGVSRTLFEPFYTFESISGLDNFALYLRPFDVDTQSIFKKRSGFTRTVYFLPENLERNICKNISEKIAPVYAIGNPGVVLPTTFNSSCIYASDDEWKRAVAELAQKAKMILLRVGDTDGCKWELLHCFNRNYLMKTIFIADDMDDIDIIQNSTLSKIPDEIKKLDFHKNSIGLWLNGQDSWEYKELKTSGDCSNMVESFTNIHPNILKHKIDFTSVIHTKSKSIWSDVISILLNPIAYVLYNRWSVKMSIAFLSYFIVDIMSITFLSLLIANEEEELFEMFLCVGLPMLIFSLIPWIVLASKYSTAINSWGGTIMKAHANRTLAKWLMVFFVFTAILGIIVY